MIQKNSILKVVDNSGVKRVRVIQIMGGTKHLVGRVGDIIVVSVVGVAKVIQKFLGQSRKRARKKDIYRGVLVGSVKEWSRLDGMVVKYSDNCIVLLNEKGVPLGSRLFSPIPYELRKGPYKRLFVLAPHLI